MEREWEIPFCGRPTFRDDDEEVLLSLPQDRQGVAQCLTPIQRKGDLRYDDAITPRHERGHDRQIATVTPHHCTGRTSNDVQITFLSLTFHNEGARMTLRSAI